MLCYHMIWYGMTSYGMIWDNLCHNGMVWFDMVRFDLVWYGMEWHDMTRHDMIWCTLRDKIDQIGCIYVYTMSYRKAFFVLPSYIDPWVSSVRQLIWPCLIHSGINECDSNPCQHNGTCVDLFDAFNCSCQEGYTGTQCEIGKESSTEVFSFYTGWLIHDWALWIWVMQDDEWSRINMLLFIAILENKWQSFQFEILHHIIGCNKY